MGKRRTRVSTMAMQPATPPTAQVVGNAFVEQYYHILHHSPELVYRFYQDASVLSRPEHNGVMTSVTTIKNINDKICSLDYKNYKAEIKTADAQESYKDGVIVLVTGCFTGKDNLRRRFTQTFFLAPQDKGYFVLNDVFRYVEENEPVTNLGIVNGTDDEAAPSLTPDAEPTQAVDPSKVDKATSHAEEVQNGEDEGQEPLEMEGQVEDERDIVIEAEPHPHEDNDSAVTEPASSISEEDAPKKSYASIVSSQTMKGPTRIYVPTSTSRVTPPKTEKQSVDSIAQAPAPEASSSASPVLLMSMRIKMLRMKQLREDMSRQIQEEVQQQVQQQMQRERDLMMEQMRSMLESAGLNVRVSPSYPSPPTM